MAHKFSSGVMVSAPSWHRLEKEVLDAGDAATKNVTMFMQKAGQAWTVSHSPICGPDGKPITRMATYADGTTEEFAVGKIAKRDDTGECIGIVGPNTHILQNVEAFGPLQPYLDAGLLTLETAGCLEGGAKVWTLAKINRPAFQVTGEDVIDKYLLVSNSHDGTLAVRVAITGVRVVCWNTLSAAIFDKSAEKDIIRIRHSSKVQVKTADAVANIERLNEAMDKGFAKLSALSTRNITTTQARQYFKDVFEMTPRKGGFELPQQSLDLLDELCGNFEDNVNLVRELHSNHIERETVAAEAQEIVGSQILTEMLETGAGQKQGAETWWSAYNAVTQYLTHNRGRTNESRFSSLYYGDSAKKNDRAFELAMIGAGLQTA